MPSSLCVYDVDQTLVDGSTVESWITFLGRSGLIDADARLDLRHTMNRCYLEGSVSHLEYREVACSEITGLSPDQVQTLIQDWTRSKMAAMIGAQARASVLEHQKRGDLLIIATASCSLIAHAVASELGVVGAVGGLVEIGADGLYTGRQIGPGSFSAGKLARVKSYLADLGRPWSSFHETHAYSDSAHDLPLLRAATHPVAVDPDPELLKISQYLGWPILFWACPRS